ncbi:hybrid sensor histidine kinase/response regulator [Limnobacter sp.]|uniref:ATP-binding response regulator n=1 Tax=Limnobacter sp. TaxID=2003368 RepID=UPI003513086E
MGLTEPHTSLVRKEQVQLLFQHLPFILMGNVASASGLVAILWSRQNTTALIAWLVCIYATCVARLVLRHQFFSLQGQFCPNRWMNFAIGGTLVSGVLWGTAGVVFFNNDPITVMALATFLAAMVAGAVSSHSCYSPAYLAYALPTALPYIVVCLFQGETFYTALAICASVFVLANISYGRNLEKTVVDSIRLRFQNSDLVDALTRQKELAEQANVAKTQFLAAASHDLRQPLQAIELLTDALGRDLANHPSRKLLDLIQDAGKGLRDLLNGLLDSSRIHASAINTKPQHIELHTLLSRVQHDFAPAAAQKGLDLRLRSTRLWVYTDPQLLERIIRNFVDNAIKYTPHGRVLIGCRRHGDTLRVEVHDTGIGIPSMAQELVFNEFHQLSNPEHDKSKGLGLGLFIVKNLARVMGLQVGLHSVPGQGSSFFIGLPICAPADTPSAASAQKADNPAEPIRGKTVLLIDDDAVIRTSVVEMLKRWHCSTVIAASAEEALQVLLAQGVVPDAIVADYRLGNNANGVQAIEALQKQLGHIPAVILTGDTSTDRIVEAQESGHLIMHKPLSAAQLRDSLSALMA